MILKSKGVVLFLLSTVLLPVLSEFLTVRGADFYYGNKKVFLSGVNFAWYYYGYDFGNSKYIGTDVQKAFESWLLQIRANGGNTIRVWVHIDGASTPSFDPNGFVTSPDASGTIIPDLTNFLDFAFKQDIFVILVLWNFAFKQSENVKNLVYDDDSKLQSYIDKALVPMVRALKGKPSLASWEIANEPEGSCLIKADSNPCFDTVKVGPMGGNWAQNSLPMQRLLRFINWQASAIHTEDAKALVTLGSWCERAQTDVFGYFNYYKDSCLISAGGRKNGIIDFYQMHAYSWLDKWSATSPFKVNRWEYNNTEKPLVIGEFAAACSQGESIEFLFDYAYRTGYSGVLTWHFKAEGHCSDDQPTQLLGLKHIRAYDNVDFGGLVNIDIK